MRLLLAAAMLVVSACRPQEGTSIPPGSYAGSTPGDEAVVLEVADEMRLNRREVEFVEPDTNHVFEVVLEGRRQRWSCDVVEQGDELRCRVTSGGDPTVTIELMRL